MWNMKVGQLIFFYFTGFFPQKKSTQLKLNWNLSIIPYCQCWTGLLIPYWQRCQKKKPQKTKLINLNIKQLKIEVEKKPITFEVLFFSISIYLPNVKKSILSVVNKSLTNNSYIWCTASCISCWVSVLADFISS